MDNHIDQIRDESLAHDFRDDEDCRHLTDKDPSANDVRGDEASKDSMDDDSSSVDFLEFGASQRMTDDHSSASDVWHDEPFEHLILAAPNQAFSFFGSLYGLDKRGCLIVFSVGFSLANARIAILDVWPQNLSLQALEAYGWALRSFEAAYTVVKNTCDTDSLLYNFEELWELDVNDSVEQPECGFLVAFRGFDGGGFTCLSTYFDFYTRGFYPKENTARYEIRIRNGECLSSNMYDHQESPPLLINHQVKSGCYHSDLLDQLQTIRSQHASKAAGGRDDKCLISEPKLQLRNPRECVTDL